MPSYVTPGVYYERADAGAASVSALRTDVAGFVGIARRGPLDLAVPLASFRQFVATFGSFTGAGYLAYAVRAFFENGGSRCWVVRVTSPAAVAARAPFGAVPPPSPLPPFRPAWSVEASSPGVWGNDVEVEWRETHALQTSAAPSGLAPDYATVKSVAGFVRGTHVRIFVNSTTAEHRVVSAVDASTGRLYWVNPRPERRLPYERPLDTTGVERPLVIESVEYTLLVYELARLVGVYERLSLCPDHPRYAPSVLPPVLDFDEGLPAESAAPATSDARPRLDAPEPSAPNPIAIVERPDVLVHDVSTPPVDLLDRRFLTGGLDGLAALTVADFVGEPPAPFDDIATRRRKRRGVRALEPVGEVAIVAVPDISIVPVEPPRKQPRPPCEVDECLPAPPLSATPRAPSVGDLPPRFTSDQIAEVAAAILAHCVASGDRFALLDPPFETVSDPKLGVADLRAFRQRFDSDFGALYAPWLLAPDPLLLDGSGLRAIPPSGHVAGFMAQTDQTRGVHRAPANGALTWVQGTTLAIDEAVHGVLNPEHVNALRVQPGRGIRILGARTLSSDPDFRFVNVRRLLLMLEKAIRIGTQWAVFEPNDRFTRSKVHLALTSLLLEMWKRGALAGATAREAFYVNCGELDNPPAARENGRLVAEVGVAPARPFEFIVVRVGASGGSLETLEETEINP
jgi:phage tail sheath protein FI